jgi:hypothetical protein
MKRFYKFLILPIIAAYCAIFFLQERLFKGTFTELQPVPSFQLLQATTGYIHQLVAEILFIKAAVFLGGVKPRTAPLSYAPALAHNYRQITELYPEFIDTYYYTQAHLPHVNKDSAKAANEILSTGITTYPNDFVLRLFAGVNYFQYLDEPIAAAEVYQEASKLPGAPPMFGHLAAILSVQGGDLEAGLITLNILLKTEEKEAVRKRYMDEIEMFQKAIEVQNAATQYQMKMGFYPIKLEVLIPEYLSKIPSFGTSFEFLWEPPQVKLRRPTRR